MTRFSSKKVVPGLLLVIFLLGAIVRALGIPRAIDQTSWRECDIAGIARNYYREGMDLCYPRIDWRGNGPGYAEMEFPILPWLMAALYHVFGINILIGRVLAYLLAIGAMAVFFLMARSFLPSLGALAACAFFATNPLLIEMATALQPEGLMFFLYVLAARSFLKWLDSGSWFAYGMALVATALAILAKAPAAHIGLLYALLLFNQFGWRAFARMSVWCFAIFALLPGAIWYYHAHQLWLSFGNSLGVSNEWHWAGSELFTNPALIVGILRLEYFHVWLAPGLALAVAGIWWGGNDRHVRFALLWCAVILLYYLVTANTTGDNWAYYYHIVSVPPAALLIGAGACILMQTKTDRSSIIMLTTLILAISLLLVVGWLSDTFGSNSRAFLKMAALFGGTACFAIAARLVLSLTESHHLHLLMPGEIRGALLVYIGSGAAAFIFLYQARETYQNHDARKPHAFYTSAQRFAPYMTDDGLVLASGSVSVDDAGRPVAYNASYFFYWLDRKGFNIPSDHLSVQRVQHFANQGARYYLAEKSSLNQKPSVETELRQRYPVLTETASCILFDIRGAK